MIYLLKILITLSVHSLLANNQSNICSDWTTKHLFNSTENHVSSTYFEFLIIDSIDDVTQMPHCRKRAHANEDFVKIYSNKPILFDNTFNLKNLLDFFSFDYFWSESQSKIILFQNVKGFNQKRLSNEYVEDEDEYLSEYIINFYDINFEFYERDRLLDDGDCIKSNFNMSFFGPIRQLMLTDNVFYNQKVCPYVFANTQLVDLSLFQIVNSFILVNRLEFVDMGDDNAEMLDAIRLQKLRLNVVYETISTKIVNKFVFKNLKMLNFYGITNSFEVDFFKNFQKLKLVAIFHEDFFNFFHAGTKWMNYLNYNLNVDMSRIGEYRNILEECLPYSPFHLPVSPVCARIWPGSGHFNFNFIDSNAKL
jgi:hypothetical protein